AGPNGSISDPGQTTLNCGDNKTYTITADPCYHIVDVIVDAVSRGAVGTYTFSNVQTDHTISASFAINTYTIDASSGPNGSISDPGQTTLNCGDNKTYTLTPDPNYHVADITVDAVSRGAAASYTFSNVQANHT